MEPKGIVYFGVVELSDVKGRGVIKREIKVSLQRILETTREKKGRKKGGDFTVKLRESRIKIKRTKMRITFTFKHGLQYVLSLSLSFSFSPFLLNEEC